jgi:hypothetical protein
MFFNVNYQPGLSTALPRDSYGTIHHLPFHRIVQDLHQRTHMPVEKGFAK